MCLGRSSFASHRSYCKTIPKCVLAKIQLHLIGINLGQLQIVSWPKFHCISSKKFQDNSKLRLSQNSIALHWNYSKTIPKFVLAEIQLHLVEIILWQFQINSWPKFHCISSKIFIDNSKLRLRQNSIGVSSELF